MKYEILFKTIINNELVTCLCGEQDSLGRCWAFTYSEEQAKDRVAALAEVGIDAWYKEIGKDHWVNESWIG